MATAVISPQQHQKSFARAALVGLDPEDVMVLRDCFAAHCIKLAMAPVAQPARLEHERFECCVVNLVPGCEPFLEEIRRSKVNRNTALIGARLSAHDLAPYWKYGFNALVDLPLQPEEAVEALRSTCLLTVRHLRRYVRVPFATEVDSLADGVPLKCLSREISAGGIALGVPPEAKKVSSWKLQFLLPTGKTVRISGATCWAKPLEHMIGVLFDPANEQRNDIKSWIESFLVD